MTCFVLSNCQLFSLKPCKGKQEKVCEFINCSLSLSSKQINLAPEGQPAQLSNMPVIQISNDDYDPDQDMQAEEVLPISEELMFLRYDDGADHMDESCSNQVSGFVFYYPQISLCKVIEIECDSADAKVAVDEFEAWLCMVLFIVNEQTKVVKSTSRDVMI